ncbi:flavin reductase family protein [Megasphaera paucivorans]|uniref:NADH-FMN oxidoreductase RutF, flavin reductase (DIM6/NTAB) family n=1 Tax=Megasphaera paucivorans TaxID=349095 RepID=A0A1G9R1H2_9FIRM|nr:flavin reductase family protein [Megasphaera paucivorans]SDM16950.1 NADH-FMN oxidoreductase RutF, flavin reductase (DIM6/NTAB) family [Megasphaera paucivorans]
MALQKVDLNVLTPEVFSVFGTQNALLTAGDKSNSNTMTIGWCGLGRMWNLPSCNVYVRQSRYTFNFIEKYQYFTISVLPRELHDKVTYCGIHSGRDVDKFQQCGLTLQYGIENAPFIAEAEWGIVCKKLYAQDLKPESVIDERVFKSYAAEGWHRMYIGEVLELYMK